jgi:hypothetical protein
MRAGLAESCNSGSRHNVEADRVPQMVPLMRIQTAGQTMKCCDDFGGQ